MKNPFEAHKYMESNHKAEIAGKEIINGVSCSKQVIKVNGEIAMIAYISDKYNFPVKVENKANGFLAELKGMRVIPVDPVFFEIPDGYKKQEIEKKGTAKLNVTEKSGITQKIRMAAPVKQRVGAGGELHVKVRPEMHIKLVLVNENQANSNFTLNTYKDDIPVSSTSLKKRIFAFTRDLEKKEFSFNETTNPDTIEIKVTKGLVYVDRLLRN